MNREQRRRLNKKNHVNWTKEEWMGYFAYQRLKSGASLTSLDDVPSGILHIDNTDLVPDGKLVKLNYEEIKSRFDKKPTDYSEEFKEWVEKNKNKKFHVTREGAKNSLVCLEEDQREKEIDGKVVKVDKWLFDCVNDLLIQKKGEWVTPYSIMKENKKENN